mgnify:CR=1 FL=1
MHPYAEADYRHERQLDAALAAEYAAIANAEYRHDDCAALAGSLKAEFVGNCDENNPPQIEHWHEWLLDPPQQPESRRRHALAYRRRRPLYHPKFFD